MLKGIGDKVNYAKALLARGVEGAESKQQVFKEVFLEYFGEHGKEADWPVGGWVSLRFNFLFFY